MLRYLLFPNIHEFGCASQALDLLGSDLHHAPDLSPLLRPRRHALDGHPLCQALQAGSTTGYTALQAPGRDQHPSNSTHTGLSQAQIETNQLRSQKNF